MERKKAAPAADLRPLRSRCRVLSAAVTMDTICLNGLNALLVAASRDHSTTLRYPEGIARATLPLPSAPPKASPILTNKPRPINHAIFSQQK